jgi:Soluble NSF attachment protein, SNAP
VDDLRGLPARRRDALHAELLTEQANARRLQADRGAANELLDRALRMAHEGAGGPALLARIGSIRASIRLDEGNPAEAILLLSDVRQTYEKAGETHQVGRTMVQIANIVSVFDPAGAYQAACGALGYLSRQDDLRTRASALGMMVECLIEQGLVGEALRELQEHQAFLEQFSDPALQVRVRVMEARLAALLDHEEEALQLFANVIDECYERGLYQLMSSYQAFLLGFHVDRKKWTKAVELCTFAAGQEELPEGVRKLWRKLEASTRSRTLAPGEIQEARRQLRADWAQMAVS